MEKRRKKRKFRMWFHPLVLLVIITIFVSYDVYRKIVDIKTDFPNYYTASKMMLDNKDLSGIYDNRYFQKHSDLYGIEYNIVSFVPHTPPSLLFYAPVAFFEPDTAKKIWTFLNFLFFAGSIFLLMKTFEMRLHHVAVLAVSFVMPVVNNFIMGQAYFLILFLISLGLYLWRSERQFLSGIVIGAATSFKPFPGFLIIPALLSKKWKIIAGMIIGFTIPHIIVLLISPEIYQPYLNHVLPATLSGDIQNPYHIAFRSYSVILKNLFIADPARNPSPLFHSPYIFTFLKITIALLIIHLFSFIHVQSEKSAKTKSVHTVTFFLVASLLIAPISSSYQYVLLIPAMLALVTTLGKYKIPGVLNLHTFYIFSVIKPVPFVELGYMTLFSIASFFSTVRSQREILFKRTLIWGLPILLLSLAGAGLLTSAGNNFDDAEYVAEIKTTGFPGELKIEGDNIFFTEILDGNYVINYNSNIIRLDGYDLFEPEIRYNIDGEPELTCTAYGNGKEIFQVYSLKTNQFIKSEELSTQIFSNSIYIDHRQNNDIFHDGTKLTSHPARDYSPALKSEQLPDGTIANYIYFISERGGGFNDGRFYRIRIDD